MSSIFDVIDLSILSIFLAEKLKFLVDLSTWSSEGCRSFLSYFKQKKLSSFIIFHIIWAVLFLLQMSMIKSSPFAFMCQLHNGIKLNHIVIRMCLCGHTVLGSLNRVGAAAQYHTPSTHVCLLYSDDKCQQQNRNQRALWYKTTGKWSLYKYILYFSMFNVHIGPFVGQVLV